MREIKFRYVFKKPNGHIVIYFTDIQHLEHGDIANFLQHNFLSIERDLIARDLYTGLTDKNDKEIYGEDIVRGKDGSRRIEYKGGNFVARKLRDSKNYTYEGITTKYLPFNWKDQFEVIGNIYENKELLEVKDERRR